jgi:hypothetical protein
MDPQGGHAATSRGQIMARVAPYHSSSPEDRDVYHDHDDCPDGRRILPENWQAGSDGRQRCEACIDLG